MANKEPTQTQERISLLKQLNNRDAAGTKDNSYINIFFEIIKNKTTNENEYLAIQRAGSAALTSAIGSGAVRGIFYWNFNSSIYYAIGTGLYKYDVVGGSTTTINATFFSTSTGEVGFTEFLYEPVGAYGSNVLMISDGTQLYQIDQTATVTPCVDADLPSPHLPQPIFLDGYLFLAKVGTADLFNSDLNDPLAWTPSDFITAEFGADNISRVAKLNNYIIAFGTNTIEYFWDAANSSGSPLQSNPTPIKINGYLGGAAQIGNKIYFIGNNESSEPGIFVLEDFKITAIENQTIKKYLASLTLDLASNVVGSIVSFMGHDFYVINASTQTYVMELASQLLTTWAWQNTANFTMTGAINIKSSTGYKSVFARSGSTQLYYFNPAISQDANTSFTCTIVTDNEEFNSYNRKTMGRLTIWADKPTATLPVNVSWTDDDYQSYSTPIAVDLYQDLPSLNRLGEFRRRAFKLTWTSSVPIRIFRLECLVNKGER